MARFGHRLDLPEVRLTTDESGEGIVRFTLPERIDVGDGLLIVVAKNDRRLWIAPAKALEGSVPDLAARQIIQNTITPPPPARPGRLSSLTMRSTSSSPAVAV